MRAALKNWLWFLALMILILGGGIFLGHNRRADLGRGFDYSLEDYRKVDPLLIKYRELEPLIPSITNLTALAIDSSGQVYVGGMYFLEVIGGAKFSISGTPSCIAVDDEGTIYVGLTSRVMSLSKDGQSSLWSSPGEKAYLTSIAVDDRYVYAADAGSRRVWRYDKSGGEPLEIGKKDAANNVRGFNIPSPSFDIAISPSDGSLWAVNPGYHALENYHPDGMPLSKWEAGSMRIEGFSGCCNPSHFALMSDGAFVTAEKGLPRVKIHNVDGSLRCVVAAPDQFDEGITGLDVAVGADSRIYVLDANKNQIRVFEEIE